MTLSIPSMELVSSTSKLPRMYDVLINFTGEDIRRKFVSHLDYVLSSVGLTTFLQHDNAVQPKHIQEPILNLCRVAIVVFTETYSQSACCLHQLQQIIEWHETYGRHVLPVYYEIQPSDVRLQKGDFGKAFRETAHQTFSAQELEHGMSRWSHAITKAANFFGWDDCNYRSDAELVDTIVKSIINLPVLSATKFPVELHSLAEEVLASSESSDVSLPGGNDPYWLAHMGEGHSVSFTLPQDRVMKGIALCVVYFSTSKIIEPKVATVLIVNYTKCTLQMHNHSSVVSSNDEDWDFISSNLESGDKVEIFVTSGHGLLIKNTAVYLIYGESNDLEMEPCPEPKKNGLNKFIKKMLICDFC
ncbi:hypothetical protein LR48_Vigan11g145700 [Vigna angularis]|uniref:TIR domain-containing protein n=1 Tax=Phaseolus angularis TaxID=3914 RepID=A0A0L9VU17_PHAAN|nr:hypothetical protein LR48_Vigan11g145700 [Vigna angularis]